MTLVGDGGGMFHQFYLKVIFDHSGLVQSVEEVWALFSHEAFELIVPLIEVCGENGKSVRRQSLKGFFQAVNVLHKVNVEFLEGVFDGKRHSTPHDVFVVNVRQEQRQLVSFRIVQNVRAWHLTPTQVEEVSVLADRLRLITVLVEFQVFAAHEERNSFGVILLSEMLVYSLSMFLCWVLAALQRFWSEWHENEIEKAFLFRRCYFSDLVRKPFQGTALHIHRAPAPLLARDHHNMKEFHFPLLLRGRGTLLVSL